MRSVFGCAMVLLGGLALAGCSSSYDYQQRIAQARAEHVDVPETMPQPVRHARKAPHGPRVKMARGNIEATDAVVSSKATETMTRTRATPPTPDLIRTSTQANAYLRDRMRRPSPIVDSPEWKLEKAADARRERQIDHTIHSICTGC